MGADVSTVGDCTYNNTIHVSSVEEAHSYYLLFTDFEEITTKVAFPIILAVGLLGNVAFLFTVIRVRSMRTATNFYLSNLAVADLMFLLIAICSRLRVYVIYGVPNEAPVFGQAGCVLQIFSKYVFNFAGMIFITFISLERYIAVCHPIRHRLISGRSRSAKLIVVCWLVALLLAPLVVPSNLKFSQYCLSWATDDSKLWDKFPRIIGRCDKVEGKWAYQLFHLTQTVPFFVAFFGNSFFYTRILLKLHRRDTYDRQQIIHTRNQVAVMLVANGTVFLLTMTAFEVTSVILFAESFLDDDVKLIPDDIRSTLFEINRILVYVNSAVNPIVYTLTNARYRRAFKKAFAPGPCTGNRRQRTSTVISVTAARDLYRLTGHSRNQTLAIAGNGTPGHYLNLCFDHVDESPVNGADENATTVFSSERYT